MENVFYIVFRYPESDLFFDEINIRSYLARMYFSLIEIEGFADKFPWFAEEFQEIKNPWERSLGEEWIEGFFVTHRSIRPDTEALCREPNRNRIETCRLKRNISSRLTHSRIHSTDDPRNGDRFLRIGDDEVLVRESIFSTVERKYRLAVSCLTDDDVSIDFIRIKSVHRLSELGHDVVRNIDEVVFPRYSGFPEHLCHPKWR